LRISFIWLFVTGMFLALTSSGALIQIPALAIAQILFRVIDQDNFWDIGKGVAATFLLPFFIAIFYALHADKFGYVKNPQDYQNYLHQFHSFWISKWRTPMLSGLGVLMTIWDRQWRGCTVTFFTIFILYFIAPLVNYKILSTSFFFTSRQYLYFDLVFPLFFLMLAMVLPTYWDQVRNKCLAFRKGIV